MKISCIIIDDELKACQLLARLLEQIPDVEVVGIYTNPFEAKLKVMEHAPQIILLDVSMPGLTGFQFADSLKLAGISSEIVYVTGYGSYTIEAIRKQAFDYILKPVSLNSLIEMVCRFKEKQKNHGNHSEGMSGKLKFNTLQGFFLLELADIMYVNADGNYSKVFLKDGSIRVITLNLGAMEARLCGCGFFRMDRSHIINLKYLVQINRKDHLCLLAVNGSQIEFRANRASIKALADLFKE